MDPRSVGETPSGLEIKRTSITRLKPQTDVTAADRVLDLKSKEPRLRD